MSMPLTEWRSTAWSVAVALVLVIHGGLLAWSATVHSPNANEPSHLAAGISHWEFGQFDLYRVNPPLVRLIAAIPVMAAGVETDWSNLSDSLQVRSEFQVGPDWVAANGERALWLTTLARWSCIPFILVGGLICYLWGRDLYGSPAGLLSLLLWSFCPNILGHGSCITPDAHATALGLTANYLFWKWLKQPGWERAAAAGTALGFALLSKTTWIILPPLWAVLWAGWLFLGRSEGFAITASPLRQLAQLTVTLLIGWHILNLGYLYDGSFQRIEDYNFISHALSGNPGKAEGNRFRGTALASLPVPFPAQYVLGIDVQKQDFERHPVSYYRGRTHARGIWYFYLYAMLLKIPLGTWVLAVAAIAARFTGVEKLRSARDELVLLAPFACVLMLVSSETDYTTHFRYVLPVLPYAFIWIGQVAATAIRRKVYSLILVTGVTWSIGSSLWYSPHWLSYFNELAGGPSNGYLHLANSNFDWGQDLIYLQKCITEYPQIQSIGLAYYGMFHPTAIGIEFEDVPGWITEPEELENVRQAADDPFNSGPRPGWYAVSANFVVGHPFWNYRADGKRGWFNRAYFTWFQQLKPVARAGYSILIYHVTEEDIRNLNGVFPQAHEIATSRN